MSALLYVEDEIVTRTRIATALRRAGFAVTVAADGTEALAALTHPFDALVTDVNLGDGPNGWHVARHARTQDIRIPVIYVSSASTAEWTTEGVDHSQIIAKPIIPADLVFAVAAILAAR